MSDQLPPQPPQQPPVPPQQPVQPPQQPAYQQPPQQPYAANPNPAPQPGQPLTAEEDKNWAMWSHFGSVLGPIPPLIIYLVFKDRGAFTKQESKEALNFEITVAIIYVGWVIILSILTAILIATGAWSLLGLLGWVGPLIWVANAVLTIMGGVKVNNGGSNRYPVNFRFIK